MRGRRAERFHKTIQDEFYAVAFRKKVYNSLEELQTDLDIWIRHYNEERTHTGKHCLGRTPKQTLIEGISLAKEKLLDKNEQNPIEHFFSQPDASPEPQWMVEKKDEPDKAGSESNLV